MIFLHAIIRYRDGFYVVTIIAIFGIFTFIQLKRYYCVFLKERSNLVALM